MGQFFIDTSTGQIATQQQLREAGIADADGTAPRPWHPCQGSIDATTLWYAPMRKRTRGIFIGTMAFRHSDHHASLLQDGWQEVDVSEIGVPGASAPPGAPDR